MRKGWCGYRPSISHFHVFCCVTFAHVLKEARTKLDSKGVKCICIGYCEETKGYILYNPINQYVIIGCDVVFDESKKFNEEIMVSKFDSRSEHVILNQEPKMEVERIPQQMQKNPTMVKENMNSSCVFYVDVDEPHSFVEALNGEDSQHWKKVMDSKFQSSQDNKTWILTFFPLDRKPMNCKWIFKIKYNVNGS